MWKYLHRKLTNRQFAVIIFLFAATNFQTGYARPTGNALVNLNRNSPLSNLAFGLLNLDSKDQNGLLSDLGKMCKQLADAGLLDVGYSQSDFFDQSEIKNGNFLNDLDSNQIMEMILFQQIQKELTERNNRKNLEAIQLLALESKLEKIRQQNLNRDRLQTLLEFESNVQRTGNTHDIFSTINTGKQTEIVNVAEIVNARPAIVQDSVSESNEALNLNEEIVNVPAIEVDKIENVNPVTANDFVTEVDEVVNFDKNSNNIENENVIAQEKVVEIDVNTNELIN